MKFRKDRIRRAENSQKGQLNTKTEASCNSGTSSRITLTSGKKYISYEGLYVIETLEQSSATIESFSTQMPNHHETCSRQLQIDIT